MLGAIYGDKAGSIYEYGQIKKITPVCPETLITSNSFYSDDTILTIAILDAITSQKDYYQTIKEYILKYQDYKPSYEPTFKTAFSPNMIKLANGIGNSNSTGNGAMMRISPVGYLFNNEEDIIENAKLVTIPSHNSKEAIKCATEIALMIYYFRCGYNKDMVYQKLSLPIEYKPFIKFNTTCQETINNCLYAIYNSTSFEDAIRLSLSMGGDTDTNACIVGSVVEAIYGLTEEQISLSKKDLPDEFIKVLKRVYK